MPDVPERDPAVAIWLEQPGDVLPVDPARSAKSWTLRLRDTTRSEILMSIGSAVFCVVLMGWRLTMDGGQFPRLLGATAAAVAVWSLFSLYWFRRRIWPRRAAERDVAASGLEYYRTELEQRAAHLRNAWLWHGPLFLSCVFLTALLAEGGAAGPNRLRTVLPMLGLLVVWIGFGIWRRYRNAAELQQHIQEIQKMAGPARYSGGR